MGGIRKATVLMVVGLAARLDDWLQPGSPIFRTAAIYFYTGRGGLSLAENLGVCINAEAAGVLDTANDGSYDFYRIVTLLDRAGIFKKGGAA